MGGRSADNGASKKLSEEVPKLPQIQYWKALCSQAQVGKHPTLDWKEMLCSFFWMTSHEPVPEARWLDWFLKWLIFVALGSPSSTSKIPLMKSHVYLGAEKWKVVLGLNSLMARLFCGSSSAYSFKADRVRIWTWPLISEHAYRMWPPKRAWDLLDKRFWSVQWQCSRNICALEMIQSASDNILKI